MEELEIRQERHAEKMCTVVTLIVPDHVQMATHLDELDSMLMADNADTVADVLLKYETLVRRYEEQHPHD